MKTKKQKAGKARAKAAKPTSDDDIRSLTCPKCGEPDQIAELDLIHRRNNRKKGKNMSHFATIKTQIKGVQALIPSFLGFGVWGRAICDSFSF